MTMPRRTILAAVGSVLLAASISAQAPTTVDYDTFWKQDRGGRVATFNQITPENRADLVRTQIQRWTDANRGRLTPEQVQFMQEMLAFVSADLYRQPKSETLVARAKELETRALTLFTREDIAQALTNEGGSYIPKQL